jgi:uncharacterized protein YndB with AHSA1/START domain
MSKNKASYVYVIYIKASPEKIWQALTDPKLTTTYWFHGRNESDWKPGSAWRHVTDDQERAERIVGKVVESKPPHKLVVTWAHPQEAADPAKVSRVAYELVIMNDATRLTVSHTELEAGSNMVEGIQLGWPMVLSNLKSMLETGKTMQIDPTCE